MKLALWALCAMGMMVINIGCSIQEQRSTPSSLVTIQYVDPGRFTDFSIQGRDVRNSAPAFTQEVTRTLEPVMERRFPGYLLTLRFTNIDLAGSRSSGGGSSVRVVVRNRTVARLSFDYLLQDKSGRTAESGSQRLVDTARTSSSGRSSQLNNENRMLRRWLESLSVPR
jgi:Protein of unknown function (DUF3016)